MGKMAAFFFQGLSTPSSIESGFSPFESQSVFDSEHSMRYKRFKGCNIEFFRPVW